MRNCDNCEFGSYALDSNMGLETLYCRESNFEYEVLPDEVCESHQFIEGYEDEKKIFIIR